MIVAFTYDFPHWKSHRGLMAMVANGMTPDMVVSAPWVALGKPEPLIDINPGGWDSWSPERVCKELGVPYIKGHHADVSLPDADYGIILGARMLPEHVISQFKHGIINIHPGLLPFNRGLDSIKWGIIKGIGQGVTAHYIDSSVDRGKFISSRSVDIKHHMEMHDLVNAMRFAELAMIEKIAMMLEAGAIPNSAWCPDIEQGEYHTTMPHDIERQLPEAWEAYKAQVVLSA